MFYLFCDSEQMITHTYTTHALCLNVKLESSYVCFRLAYVRVSRRIFVGVYIIRILIFFFFWFVVFPQFFLNTEIQQYWQSFTCHSLRSIVLYVQFSAISIYLSNLIRIRHVCLVLQQNSNRKSVDLQPSVLHNQKNSESTEKIYKI